jgi:Recombination enhancement, RecA-dependent nuclease
LGRLKSFISYGTNTLMATKNEKNYMARVARLGCILCLTVLGYEDSPAVIHHIRRAGKRSTSPIIPLCVCHHTGEYGIHTLGRKAFERKFGTTEEALLQKVRESLG